MEIETLKRSNLKRNIIIGVVVVAIITAVVITFSRASYKSVAKVDLVDGVINYSLADFNVIAMYQQKEDSDEYEPVDEVPSSGYTLSDQSQCTVNGEPDSDITITYADGKVTFTGVTKKGTKCYLYFDEAESAKDYILTYATLGDGTPNFANTSCSNGNCGEETVGLYAETTSKGTTYYFRGDVEDNYVLFAEYYWRIIRINEDGSIRLIYDGKKAYENGNSEDGDDRQIGTSVYNSESSGGYYVGYTYTVGSQRGDTNDSTIKTALETWYSGEDGIYNYDSYITSEAGFCNDRTTYDSSGVATDWTGADEYYGAYVRLITNKTPSLECDERDLYKTKVGLITADEVAMAGGVYSTSSSSYYNRYYYLYNGNMIWTMSPLRAVYSYGFARVFLVNLAGNLGGDTVLVTYSSGGVRPVINLRADVTLTGEGTSTNPYEVSLTS